MISRSPLSSGIPVMPKRMSLLTFFIGVPSSLNNARAISIVLCMSLVKSNPRSIHSKSFASCLKFELLYYLLYIKKAICTECFISLLCMNLIEDPSVGRIKVIDLHVRIPTVLHQGFP